MSNQLEQYTELLRIRQKACFRELIFAGVLFFASTGGAIIFIALSYPVYLTIVTLLLLLLDFGLLFLGAQIRYSIIKSTLELIEVIQREAGHHS